MIEKSIYQAEIKTKMAAAGSNIRLHNAEAFAELIYAENDKWAAVINEAAIKLD